MLRTPCVILLALCVLAMPSYAAITCGNACAAMSDAHDCCPVATNLVPANDGADGAPTSNHSDAGRSDPCAAPCCGFVAHVLTSSIPHVDERPLADLLPTGSVLQDAVNHDAIFHPPRA